MKELAEEYAAKIKAVAETKEAEIETLYREYQTKCLEQIEDQDEGISMPCKASDSLAPDIAQSTQSNTH